jgi:hypothetical protein
MDTKLDSEQTIELEYIKNNFCGTVRSDAENFTCTQDTVVYLCGNIANILSGLSDKIQDNTVYVIKELSHDYKDQTLVGLGEIPINVQNVGVYFREFFAADKDYFGLVSTEHQFQKLTESNKPGRAFRKGIYLTDVKELDDRVEFNLLRCSTNLDGPTENLRVTDKEIMNRVNNVSKQFFEQVSELNHVLAQIYENTTVSDKERKAKIKEHSDKTKDMPRDGLMAFCTFYTNYPKELKKRGFDYLYKETSALTKIRFRLKSMVTDPGLSKKFDLTMYPGSVLLIPLSTNRLYTHEIVPSGLPIDKIPTRMGYVVRCSKTKAVFKDGQTYLDDKGKLIKLVDPDQKTTRELKDLYYKENLTDELMDYGTINFSLNAGDYTRPTV